MSRFQADLQSAVKSLLGILTSFWVPVNGVISYNLGKLLLGSFLISKQLVYSIGAPDCFSTIARTCSSLVSSPEYAVVKKVAAASLYFRSVFY